MVFEITGFVLHAMCVIWAPLRIVTLLAEIDVVQLVIVSVVPLLTTREAIWTGRSMRAEPDWMIAASFEPRGALDGGQDGLVIIRRLVAALPVALAPAGTALLEIGFDQGPAGESAVAALAGDWSSRIQPDLSGTPRLAHVERASAVERPGGR